MKRPINPGNKPFYENILFQFKKFDLEEVVAILEEDYTCAKTYKHAPKNYADAKENFRQTLELIGDISRVKVGEDNHVGLSSHGAPILDLLGRDSGHNG